MQAMADAYTGRAAGHTLISLRYSDGDNSAENWPTDVPDGIEWMKLYGTARSISYYDFEIAGSNGTAEDLAFYAWREPDGEWVGGMGGMSKRRRKNLLEVVRMKRFSLILLSLLLIAACAGSFAEEAPWVTMENVREHSGYVWREEIPRYNGAVEQGFQPLAMDPAEAYLQLRNAYDRGQDEATRELLQSWGIEMEPCGAPVLRELISQADLQHQGHSDVSTENVPLVQLISFSGWGWGEEGTLIFVEQWPNWYLWDYIPFSCEDFRLCGTDDGTGVYLEFGVIGHGTGCYVRYMDVYHLQTRKIEASYTTYGYEVFQNTGIQVYGSACYARDGVHIFRQLSPLVFDEAQNEFVPTGAVLDVFDYSIGEQGHLERRE